MSIRHSAFIIDHSAFIIRHPSFINQSTIDQKSIKNRSKIDKKSIKNRPKSVLEPPRAVLEASRERQGPPQIVIFESISKVRFEKQNFGPQKGAKKGPKIDVKNETIFDPCQNRFFFSNFGPKMEPQGHRFELHF